MTVRQAEKAYRAAMAHVQWCERRADAGSRVCREALPQAYRDLREARAQLQRVKAATPVQS